MELVEPDRASWTRRMWPPKGKGAQLACLFPVLFSLLRKMSLSAANWLGRLATVPYSEAMLILIVRYLM